MSDPTSDQKPSAEPATPATDSSLPIGGTSKPMPDIQSNAIYSLFDSFQGEKKDSERLHE